MAFQLYVDSDGVRMFFKDIERHHLPHIHAEYQGDVAYTQLKMDLFSPAVFRKTSINWLLHGLKFAKKTSLQTGN